MAEEKLTDSELDESIMKGDKQSEENKSETADQFKLLLSSVKEDQHDTGLLINDQKDSDKQLPKLQCVVSSDSSETSSVDASSSSLESPVALTPNKTSTSPNKFERTNTSMATRGRKTAHFSNKRTFMHLSTRYLANLDKIIGLYSDKSLH